MGRHGAACAAPLQNGSSVNELLLNAAAGRGTMPGRGIAMIWLDMVWALGFGAGDTTGRRR